jgi:hypothetical protein
MREIYVLAYNGGYEGWSGPVQAFLDEAEAFGFAKQAGLEVFKVPVWPAVNDKLHWEVGPVERQ